MHTVPPPQRLSQPIHTSTHTPEEQPQANFQLQHPQAQMQHLQLGAVPAYQESQFTLPRTLVFGYSMGYDQFPGDFHVNDRTNYNISSQERQGSVASSTQKDSPKAVPYTKPRSKSAHNVIEQRYRNKINDKFQILQRAVPTLRVLAMQKKKYKEFEDSSEEDLDEDSAPMSANEVVDLEGLEPARKLNKGTILAKSIEYIRFLELKNDRLRSEHEALLTKAKMMGIE